MIDSKRKKKCFISFIISRVFNYYYYYFDNSFKGHLTICCKHLDQECSFFYVFKGFIVTFFFLFKSVTYFLILYLYFIQNLSSD